MAGCVPAWAQDAGTQPLRGSIAPEDAADGVAQGTTPTTPALGGQPIPAPRTRLKPQAGPPTAPPPLGGLGDVLPATKPPRPLGGMGDEPPKNPRESVEEPVPPEEAPPPPVEEEEETLTVPITEEVLPRQIHSALNPEPHDLDPYLPMHQDRQLPPVPRGGSRHHPHQ